MLIDIFDTFPNLLKSGFIGLVAIFAILLYFLFKTQLTGALSTKDFLIRILPFIIVTLLLLGLSGYSIYTNRNSERQNVIDSLQNQINYYKGLTPENESLQQRAQRIKSSNDSLKQVLSKLTEDSTAISKSLNSEAIDIANEFEKYEVDYSQADKPEIAYNKLKNTIFQNLFTFHADTSILRLTLQIIKSRGLKFDEKKIIQEIPTLVVAKRNWLKKVIPTLAQGIEDSHQSPVQSRFNMEFQLPKEAWITSQPYTVYFSENSLDPLTKEKKLLEQIIK